MPIAFKQNSKQVSSVKLQLPFLTALACASLLWYGTTGICSTPEDKARAYAHQLVNTGHSYEGCKILLQICRKHPKDANLILELAETHLHDDTEMVHGQTKAEQYCREALKIDPQFGKAYRLLAEWANGQCKYDAAIQFATKALSVKKPDMQAYVERATSYSNQHKDKQALADLDKFISMGKAQRKTYERRATILEKLQMYDRALADYRYLQKQRYDEPTALKEALCLEKLNKTDEAVVCLNGLLKINPEDEAALEARGRIRAKQGRYKESISDYSSSIQLIPSAVLYKQRADVYEKLGRKDLAARDRKEAERF